MWYNKNIPELKLTKGGIFMSKGHPNKQYSPEFKIKVIETMHNEGLSHSLKKLNALVSERVRQEKNHK